MAAASVGGALFRTSLRAQAAGISVTPLRDKLHLLSGAGGNIMIQEGPEGLLLIDSGLSTATAGILAETAKIGNGKVTLLFNTHWHTDHTGSNVALGKQGVKIIAQENVRTRLAKGQYMEFFQRQVDPMAPEGLPGQTFRDKGKIKFGGETAHYEYLPPAHTDGDSVLHFQNANVFHGGDLLFNGLYPFIDYGSAGSLAGMAANAERILKMVDDDTIIIPGHGPIAKKGDVKEFADMLSGSLEIFTAQIKAGKSLAQIQADKPFKVYDEKWGKMMIKPDQWIALNYSGMTKQS
jgi:glyoxylase-like metal-dependent hydrolase (beta-lactamase superfamily II)